MALKAILDSLEDLDESFHGLYTEVDGKFILDLDDDISDHPKTGPLKRALDREREAKKTATEKVDALEADFLKFKDIDPDKARAALDKIQEFEDSQLIDAGKVDELVEAKIDRMRTDFTSKIDAKDGAITTLTTERDAAVTELSDLKIFSEVERAALKSGAKKTALDDIKNRARPVFRLIDGDVVAFRPGSDEQLYGKDGDPMGIDEWVSGLSSDADHLFDPNEGGSSGGSGTRTRREGVKVISRSDAGSHLEEIASGEVVISE